MAAEAARVEREGHARRQRQLAHLQPRPVGLGPVNPAPHVVARGPPHGRVVERPAVPVEHDPLALPDADADLPGHARSRGVDVGEVERQDLSEPGGTASVERDVATGLELQAVQRCLKVKAATVHRRRERQDGGLELLAHAPVDLE